MQPYTGIGKFANYPENEVGALLRNSGKKLPNHAAPQPTRPGFSTISQGDPRLTVFILLRIYFRFLIFLTDGLESVRIIFYARMTDVFVVFGRSA
jgi:hypothetical protein